MVSRPIQHRDVGKHARARFLKHFYVGLLSTTILSGCQDGSSPVGPGAGSNRMTPDTIPGLAVLHAAAPDARVVPNRFIVRLRSDIPDVPATARALATAHGDSLHFIFEHAIRGFSVTLRPGALEALRRAPQVLDIDPVVLGRPQTVQTGAPNHLDRIDQRRRPLDNEYEYFYSGAGVNVYIIDTGIRSAHSEFAGRIGSTWWAVPGDPAQGQDCDGHGTAVASAAVGTISGVSKGATVHGVKIVFICERDSQSDYAIAGMNHVAANHVKPAVANMSYLFPRNTMVDAAAAGLIGSGVSFTISAGNGNTDACNFSPNTVLNTIVVGATNNGDSRYTQSNWGACVNLFAPGYDLLVADGSSTTAMQRDTGTSVAAPQAAGVAALLLQQDPWISPALMKSLLESGATQGILTGDLKGSPNRLLYSKVTSNRLIVHIDGPSSISTAGTYTWSAPTSGGDGSYQYQWEQYSYNTDSWTSLGTGSSQSIYVDEQTGSFDIKVTVSSGGRIANDKLLVENFVSPPRDPDCGTLIIC